jgi:chromosome partitioning protein
MKRVIACVSQKGGVGKTSLTQNLGAELARQRECVLLIDFDPQANLTVGWGIDPGELNLTVYDALENPREVEKTVIRDIRPGLDLMPASLDLAGAELAFINAIDRNYRLRKVINALPDAYGFVLIDAPPSLGFFTVTALAAATEALIPLQVQPYAYKALDQLLDIIRQVQEINEKLTVGGIVLTMYDRRNLLTGAVEEQARSRFGRLVFQTVIPVNVRIAEAPLDGKPVIEYEPKSTGALAYHSLAREVLDRGTHR